MSEARKIVTENVTAADLPERFRGTISPSKTITVVVIEKDDDPAEVVSDEPAYLKLWGIAAHRNTSIEDAVARIRELRDEWDDR
jgi:hypothetical protein